MFSDKCYNIIHCHTTICKWSGICMKSIILRYVFVSYGCYLQLPCWQISWWQTQRSIDFICDTNSNDKDQRASYKAWNSIPYIILR